MPSPEARPSGLDRVLFEIAEIARPRRLRRGETIYLAGNPSPDFFLVVDGRLRIERITMNGPQALGAAHTGDFVGAAEALLAIPRLGQAVADDDVRLFAIPAAEIFGGAPSPELGDYVLRRLASYLRSLNDEFGKFFGSDLSRSPIGEPAAAAPATVGADEKSETLARIGLASADAEILSSFCREEAYPQGAVIFREGDEGNALSVIARGKVRISRRIPGAGEEAFAILEPGAIFGEMAVFEPDLPLRSADAIAHSECVLLTLDRSVIERLRTEAPAEASALTAALCRLAARRIAETSERLVRWRMMAGMF
jgi:CRP-like cAMP-binding protein